MATQNIQVSVTGLLANPAPAGEATKTALHALGQLFRNLASGESVSTTAGPVTLTVVGSAVSGSGTVTFSAPPAANDTVTIAGTALTAIKQNATGTVTFSSLLPNDTVTVNGVVYTASASATPTGTGFYIGASDNEAATNLATAVNAVAPSVAAVTAASASAVVTFRAVSPGTGGNAITLASSNGGRAAVSGATLSGGAAVANNQFDPGGTATQAAASLAAAVNASTTAAVSQNVTATSAAGVATLKARSAGPAGNVALAKSGSNIAVSGATLTGGALGTSFTAVF